MTKYVGLNSTWCRKTHNAICKDGIAQTEMLGISFVQRHRFNCFYLFLISIQKSSRLLTEGSIKKTWRLVSVSFMKALNRRNTFYIKAHEKDFANNATSKNGIKKMDHVKKPWLNTWYNSRENLLVYVLHLLCCTF